MSSDPASLANALLACPEAERSLWLSAHVAHVTIELIAELKRRSDSLLIADPVNARSICAAVLLVAEYLPHEPLALPLARWAYANWLAYHDPNAAIHTYRLAMQAYQDSNDQLSVARLLGNLVFASSDCGRFDEAAQAYQQAATLYQAIGEAGSLYLLRLEQNYGWLLHNQGQYKQALSSYQRAMALAQQIDQPVIGLELLVNSAVTLAFLGQLDESKAALGEARHLAVAHQQDLTIARIDLNLGWLYTAYGHPAEALRHFQIARERFAILGNQMEVGTVLLWEAELLERVGALREARIHYVQAVAQFETLTMLPLLGHALLGQASAYRKNGLFRQSQELLERARQIWQQLEQTLWLARVYCEQAALDLAQHHSAHALYALQQISGHQNNLALSIQHDLLFADAHAMDWHRAANQESFQKAYIAYQRVQEHAMQNGDRWAQRQAVRGLGLLVLAHSPAEAQSYLEAAAMLDDMNRQTLRIEELKAAFQGQISDIFPVLAQLAIEQGQPQQALVCAWRAKGSALLDLLAIAEEEAIAPTKEKVVIEQLRQQIASRRWQQLQATSAHTPDSYREQSDPEIVVLEQQLISLRRHANHDLSLDRTLQIAQPSSVLEQMHADLLIEYLLCDERILAICATPTGSYHTVWIGPLVDILDVLDELQLSLQNVLIQSTQQRLHAHDAWQEEIRLPLGRLYELLFAPLLAVLYSQNKPDKLLIASCDPLYRVPFAALWDGSHYLVEHYEMIFTPSGALLSAPALAPAKGRPLMIASSAEGRLASVADEAATVLAAFPDSIGLVDDPQALTYLQGMPEVPALVHIAAHSVLREDAPIFSALQLAHSMLSVEQCYELTLRGCQLVVLSSCVTAAGLESGGSLLAFQSAFFVAGAKHVLSSLWQLDDEITTIWMQHFYAYLSAGHSPAAALRLTQQALLKHPATDHPALWGAFVCSQR